MQQGCRVSVLCPRGHPLTYLSSVHGTYWYSGLFSLASLRRAIGDAQPDIVIPCDDGVTAQLHSLYERDPSLRDLIERSLGSPVGYPTIESRYRLLTMASEAGIRVPKTKRVTRAEDLSSWHSENGAAAVLKIDGDSGGNGVRISSSLDESLAAWRELGAPLPLATAFKRVIIDRDPLALWTRRQLRKREVTVQEFIRGRPANSMLLCWRGQLLSMVSVVVVASEGPTGAATIVRVIDDERMRHAARVMASQLQMSGFCGLDFVIEAGTGIPVLIELNPRCTQLGHIELPGVGSLGGILSATLKGEAPPQPRNPLRGDRIALFPQALSAGETCRPYLEASYHDVPSEAPRMVSELKRKPWPRRQWVSRIYHAFRHTAPQEPVVFEGLDGRPCDAMSPPRKASLEARGS
jgi:hypothetical protein